MHPTRDELRAFLLGKIDEQQALSINSHIDTCPACEDTFQSLETFEDKLVHLLRTAPVDDPYEQEPACQELIRRVESMSWNSPSGSAETAAAGAVPAAPAAALGKIGQYELVEKLGEGGMGAVYKARHTRLKRMVAIKVLPPDRMDNAEAVARFQREMEAVGRLQHPNIVAAHDAGEVDGTHFLVMEFVNGLTLSTLAQQPEALGVANACELVRQAACGLEHAHQHGLVHRDIKPSNLILARDGTVKVLDLGLARLWGADVVEDELTSTGQIMGTADYIAPDQALDPHGADIRADIYSLGCTLYHLLAGRPPFRGPGFVNVIQKVMAHAQKPVPPLQEARQDLPAGLIDVIDRMLAKSPADRYATPAALIAALEPYCAGASLAGLVAPLQGPAAAPGQGSTHATASRDVGALCETHITTSAQEAPAEPASTTLAAAPPRRGSGRRLTTIAGGAAALVLLLGVILLKTGSGELELHVNEPDVQVSIDGTLQKIELKSPRDQVTITVPAGKHTLRVGKDGFEADVQEFRIVRNGKVELSATLKPLSAAKSDPARQTDPVPVPVKTAAAKAGWQGWPADAPPPAIAPFNAEQAQQHQEAWAKYLGVPVEYTNSLGMKFRLIPPGEFMMGSTPEEIEAALKEVGEDKHWQDRIKTEAPQHKVILTHANYLGVNEVTQAEYEKVMGSTPSHFAPMGMGKQAVAGLKTVDHPVEMVSGNDAAEFCAKLSKQEKLKPFYFRAGNTITPLEGTGYLLPSEGEWEFACRAGTAASYWIGDQDEDLVRAGWFVGNSGGRTHAVGELKANPFGLYDIHGNVWEWVQDGWDATCYGQFQEKPAINPSSPFLAGSMCVIRGGGWDSAASHCRSSPRHAYDPTLRKYGIGFRVSLPVDAVREALTVTGPAMPKSVATTPSAPVSAKPGWHGWPADAPPPAIAPFDAEQAQHHQEAWAKYLGVPVEYTNSLGMKFRLIPPGEFMMGSTKEEIEAALKAAGAEKFWQERIKSEAPQHKVILTQPTYLGVYEVTQVEYEKVIGKNPAHFAQTGPGKDAVAGKDTTRHPVEMVSWHDAAEFCAKLSQQEKLKPLQLRAEDASSPLDGTGYRLPSEAEWELACRAGTITRYWIGDTDEDLMRAGWFGANAGGLTHEVGELKANPFGLSDIHGNVWEWVQDWWDPAYYEKFQDKPALDPRGSFSDGSQRVIRGGYWFDPASFCGVSHRHALVSTYRDYNFGFRAALSVDAVRQALKVTGPAMPKAVATTPSAPASDAIDFAAERQAAEWVLKVGGTLGLADEQGQPMGLVEGKLPTINFVVKSVSLQDKANVTDAGLANLAGCRRLAVLSLRRAARITAVGMKSLTSVKSLLDLDVRRSGCGDDFMPLLASWPRLAQLGIGGELNPVTDAGLKNLPQLPAMRTVVFDGNPGRVLTDVGLSLVGEHCPHLEALGLQYLGDDVSFQSLQHMLALKYVSCSGTLVTVAGIEALKSLPKLEHLSLDGGVTDDSLRHAAALEGRLTKLTIEGNGNLTTGAWQHLHKLTRLSDLWIGGAALSDDDLAVLALIPELQGGLRISTPPERRRYTSAGVAKFRELRPDVGLSIDGKAYPATSVIPFSIIQQLDETDPLPGWELPAGAPPPVVAPCDPTLAKERQQLWAEFLKRPVIEELDLAALSGTALAAGNAGTTSVGKSPAASAVPLKFALIPPGEFRKIFTRPRDPAIEPDMPVRRFRITKPFAVSTTEVTWDQFRQFVEATGYQTEAETSGTGGRDRAFQPDPKITWRTPGWTPDPNEPVTQVTPRDAEAFCEWLTDPESFTNPNTPNRRAGGRQPPDDLDNKKSDDAASPKPDAKTVRGLTPAGSPKVIYRLPTEAEWAHACRAGSVHKHVVGPDPGDLADYAWTQEFLDPNPQASPLHLVAQKKPNPFGLHDTLGNVWEYTRDSMTPALLPYLATNDPLSSLDGNTLGSNYGDTRERVHPDWGWVGWNTPQNNQGFRVLKQFDAEPLPGPLDRPLVLRAGQPLSVHALVPRPEKIPGLQSWSLELAGTHGTNPQTAIAASPNGDLIATSSLYGKISLWDRDGNYQRALLGHENMVTSLHFSPDGRWLASGDEPRGYKGTMGCTVRIWDVATGAVHALIPSPIRTTRGLKFSPDSKQLAVSTDEQYKTSFFIFDLATGQIRLPVTEEQRGRGLAWSPDGTKLVSSATDGSKPSRLRIWDVATLKVLHETECPLTYHIWSPDGAWIATRDAEAKVAIRDANTLEVTKTLGAKAWPIAWMPDSKRLVVGQDGSPSGIFDATTGEQLTKIDAAPGAVFDEGKQAVLEFYGRLVFYDTSTGQKLREGKERGRSGGVVTKTSNHATEVFANWYGNIFIFDVSTGSRKRQFANCHPHPHNDLSIQLSPDDSLCAIIAPAGHHSVLVIADPQTGEKHHELSHGEGKVTRVAWSPDGKWLATGATDKLVRVWNVATGKIEHELAGHTGTIWSLAWSPDGTRLASAAEDKTVRLWDPLAGKIVATYDQLPEAMNLSFNPDRLAWTPDSRRLWIALSFHIVPLDVETGTFGPLENFSNGYVVTFVSTSPDGRRLLTRDVADWTFVRGRDAQDRRLLGQYLGQTAQWHPDSRRFLGWEGGYGTVGFDVETNRRLGMLFPWLTGDHWLCLGPTGHYRGSPGVEDQFVYVALLPDGSQQTFTPAEFAKTFGWKNDPEKAELLGK